MGLGLHGLLPVAAMVVLLCFRIIPRARGNCHYGIGLGMAGEKTTMLLGQHFWLSLSHVPVRLAKLCGSNVSLNLGSLPSSSCPCPNY